MLLLNTCASHEPDGYESNSNNVSALIRRSSNWGEETVQPVLAHAAARNGACTGQCRQSQCSASTHSTARTTALRCKVHLLILLARGRICSLHDELCREDVGQLSAVAVAPACGLLLLVVEVRASEQVPKDQLRHIALLLLVLRDRDALAIVPHADGASLCVDGHLELGHVGVALLVVSSVHDDLVEDLVQARDVRGGAPHNPLALLVVHPHVLFGALYAADVRVWAQQDVL
eukprot:9804-Heterococcus_DN1.PRE.3